MTPREAVERSVRAFEGGDSNHPDDGGSWTRFGLTYANFRYFRPNTTDADFRALSIDDVIDLLTEEYGLKPGYWRIADHWVMWLVIDFSIHSGPRTATRALQRAVGVPDDGIFGPQTTKAVNGSNPDRVFRRLMAARVRHIGQIIRRDRSQATFAGGWCNRLADILEAVA